MTRLIKTIAAAFVSEQSPKRYRFSRGIGPRPAPKSDR